MTPPPARNPSHGQPGHRCLLEIRPSMEARRYEAVWLLAVDAYIDVMRPARQAWDEAQAAARAASSNVTTEELAAWLTAHSQAAAAFHQILDPLNMPGTTQ